MDDQIGIWRRFGDAVYAAVVIAAFALQIAAMGFVTFGLIGSATGLGPKTGLRAVVIGATAMVALALFMLVVYVLAQHAIGSTKEDSRVRQQEEWSARWLRVLFGMEDLPKDKVSAAAGAALLDLAETVTGPEAQKVRGLMVDHGIQGHLLKGAAKRRMAARLDALEGLAKARLPEAMPLLLRSIDVSSHRAVATLAARAASRTLAALPAGPQRTHLSVSFGEALARAGLPTGVIEEALLLAEEAAVPAERYLLVRPELGSRELKATLDAVGRAMARELASSVVAHGDHDDPEVRAAALRGLSRLHVLPPKAFELITSRLEDPVSFVRVQATRALCLVRPDVAERLCVGLLGDPSWWVRKASAEVLLTLGPGGTDALVEAASMHEDRYARDMAAQVLRDGSSQQDRTDVSAA